MTDTSEPLAYQAEHVRSALAHDPRVGELGLTVVLVAGKVYVTGTVATTERQQAVSIVLTELLPDYEVHNDVAVPDLSKGPKQETLG